MAVMVVERLEEGITLIPPPGLELGGSISVLFFGSVNFLGGKFESVIQRAPGSALQACPGILRGLGDILKLLLEAVQKTILGLGRDIVPTRLAVIILDVDLREDLFLRDHNRTASGHEWRERQDSVQLHRRCV